MMMNRRSFFIRAAQTVAGAVASVTIFKSISLEAKTAYRTYVMGQDAIFFDKSLVPNLKEKDSVFKMMANRRAIPMSTTTNRQFFQYKVK